MKRIICSLALLSLIGYHATAQIGTGGFPLSAQAGRSTDYIPVTTAALPDWNSGLEKWNAQSQARPYLMALTTPTDLGFPYSGVMYTQENGVRVWRAQISITGAKALGFYYDSFHLPKGVKYYISNANGKQILGAYTSSNNDPSSGTFVNEAVQGDLVNLELDIDADVNLSDIKLHIDRSAVYSRGVEYLNVYTLDGLETIDAVDSALAGGSSVCMINAACPESANYTAQRDATFQWLIVIGQGVGACSATMINAASNTTANCKQYFLLASHCDGSNNTTSGAFNQVLMRFSFQHATCSPTPGVIPNTTHTLNGANFIARSIIPAAAEDIKGDFMLMESRTALPASWNVNLAGWNNTAGIPTTQASPKKFIGFHHPGGDVKKVSSSQAIQSTALGAPGSHWATQLSAGLAAEGSSGSALFDGDGRIIGVASVAAVGQGVSNSCKLDANGDDVSQSTSNIVLYSKFSYNWDYAIDGSANNRKLKPWLDPANTGVTTVNTVKSNCTALDGQTGITISNNQLDEAINLYPNPSTNGRVNIQFNLKDASDLHIELYDISGKQVKTYEVKNMHTGTYAIDMGNLSNGMYLFKFSDGYSVSSKKVMLAR